MNTSNLAEVKAQLSIFESSDSQKGEGMIKKRF
jgi:hypothetical protein